MLYFLLDEVIANTGTQFLPWEIVILPEKVFYDHKQIIELPNSACVDVFNFLINFL